jgi:ABC-type bacteriocin/lantibiotic exporter with double-glycine peptidase domain
MRGWPTLHSWSITSIDRFSQLLEQTEHPILYFERSGTDFIPLIVGKDNTGKPIHWSPNQTIAADGFELKDPIRYQNQPDTLKDGQVIFIVTFPMEALVSDDSSLSKDDTVHLTPVQRLGRLLRNERKDIGYIYFYAIVVGLISLILPLGVQAIFGLVASGTVFSSVYVLMGLVLLGLIGSGIMQIIQVTLVEVLQRRIFAKAAFEFTYRLPRIKTESLFDSHPPELMNRFFDVLTIQKSLPKFLIELTAALLQIIFGLLLLSFYHPFFIAFSFVVILVFIAIVRINGTRGLETSIKESKYKYRVVQWLEDIANTLYSFKLAGSTNLPIQKMDGLVNNYLDNRAKHFKILKGFYFYALGFKILVIGGLLVLGTYLLVNRQITLGQFVASEIVIVLLTAAVEKVFLNIDVVFDLLTAVDKLGHVTDLPLEKAEGFKLSPDQCPNGIELKVNNLSYEYPDSHKHALHNVNLHLKPGERVCVTGKNGSGKNTLFKILSGIVTSYEGSILYNGFSMRDLDIATLRSYVEMNFPRAEIFDGSILENLTMGRAGIKLTDVQNVLNKLGLSEEIAQLPNGLNSQMVSGGRQFAISFVTKLALGRCILTNPKLLLITDALQDLERNERLRIIELLIDPANPWTLLVLSNDTAFMGACDRVIVLEEGQISADGSYKSVLKKVALME